MVLSKVETKIETFALTFRRKSQYLNGQLICQSVSMNRDYYYNDY